MSWSYKFVVILLTDQEEFSKIHELLDRLKNIFHFGVEFSDGTIFCLFDTHTQYGVKMCQSHRQMSKGTNKR